MLLPYVHMNVLSYSCTPHKYKLSLYEYYDGGLKGYSKKKMLLFYE